MRLLLLSTIALLLSCSNSTSGLRPGHYRSEYDAGRWRYEILVSDHTLNLDTSDKAVAYWFDYFRQDPMPNVCVIYHSSMVDPVTEYDVFFYFSRAKPVDQEHFTIQLGQSIYDNREYSTRIEVGNSIMGLEGTLKMVVSDDLSVEAFEATRIGDFDEEFCMTTATNVARLNQ